MASSLSARLVRASKKETSWHKISSTPTALALANKLKQEGKLDSGLIKFVVNFAYLLN